MLQVIDDQWKDHLLSMDHLKEGIGLRGYGQKDPLVEYKKESFVLFQDMMDRIEDETVRYLFFLQIANADQGPAHRHSGAAFPDRRGRGRGRGRRVRTPSPSSRSAAAQSTIQDFTRNIQRKKEKELAELQFVGGDGGNASKAGDQGRQSRPQRPLSLRQRQEVQEVPRRVIRNLAKLALFLCPALAWAARSAGRLSEPSAGFRRPRGPQRSRHLAGVRIPAGRNGPLRSRGRQVHRHRLAAAGRHRRLGAFRLAAARRTPESPNWANMRRKLQRQCCVARQLRALLRRIQTGQSPNWLALIERPE